jgi:hypothetical protein
MAGCVRAYVQFLQNTNGDQEIDPERLDPFRARAYWQSKQEELKWREAAGELMDARDVEAEFARVFALIDRELSTLPDMLERRTGLPGPAIQLVEDVLDSIREALYLKLTEDPNGVDDKG